ncbi:alkane 1-monooxygenase [Rhodobacterales bacterium HKCCE3408]|nr:alkane 1-monooxygenase [Rhodobacterales bacterium HKCCE3408]
MPVIARYAVVTVVPLLLIVAGSFFGGYFPLLALLWLTVLAAIGDAVLEPPAPEEAGEWTERLSAGLAIGHLMLIPVVLMGLDNARLSAGAQLALFLAVASYMGQVSHPNAHELIHRNPAWLRRLGAIVYTSILFGHHVSAHRMVHHAHVGTPKDPATPLPGESFWAYVPRAWRGSAEAGFAAEAEQLERSDLPPFALENPYWFWGLGGIFTLVVVAAMGGVLGVIVFLALCALVHLQILLSDYVQHYGLQRLNLPNGRVESVGAHHSWNAPRGFSSLLMLNAPNHSEHHLHPGRPFNRLTAPEADAAPRLPYPMPIMAAIATVPGAWSRLMDRRALKVMEAAEARLTAREEAIAADPDIAMIHRLTREAG